MAKKSKKAVVVDSLLLAEENFAVGRPAVAVGAELVRQAMRKRRKTKKKVKVRQASAKKARKAPPKKKKAKKAVRKK